MWSVDYTTLSIKFSKFIIHTIKIYIILVNLHNTVYCTYDHMSHNMYSLKRLHSVIGIFHVLQCNVLCPDQLYKLITI